ncbi:GIY-YIG nuclease family protein [Fusobacterium sp.]|uniref:GIY-YIG nuclease family protein n=1 Tax=Fusobacterium sp. TaxID=68766 RepID=UPI00262EFCB8|nr:GIY-YIG nuclease family protein [Fusobacterium sp.]
MNWFVYILRCSDGSLYTGITNNLEKRYNDHLNKKGAKYTKSHLVIKLEIFFEVKNKSEASKLEYKIKKLDKKSKENLIKFKKFLDE